MTESEQATLRRLWDEGACIIGIAATMGLSYAATRKAVKALNLPERRNPRVMLTPEQDALVADLLAQGVSVSQAAKTLALPYGAVRSYVRRIRRMDKDATERAPQPISANRDEAYVRAVIANGGFIRAELRPGGRVLIDYQGEIVRPRMAA
jgi:molybdenum-dependent DNA-binding transcriptional regulator ModE